MPEAKEKIKVIYFNYFNKLPYNAVRMVFHESSKKCCKAQYCITRNCAVLHSVDGSADIIFLKSPIHRPAANP